MSERIEARLRVSADHPCLPGHFPGQPVVPGVLLLERLIEAAQESIGSPIHVRGIPQVKFLAPLQPGEEAVVVMEIQALSTGASQQAPASSLRFRIERSGQAIAQGVLQVAIERKPPS